MYRMDFPNLILIEEDGLYIIKSEYDIANNSVLQLLFDGWSQWTAAMGFFSAW